MHQDVFADNIFDDGADSGIFMPTGRKRKFEAMWHITSQKYGANDLGLQRVLSLGSYHTAWKWLHKLRRVMVRPDREKLSGMVEVDETYIGGERPGKRGRGAENKTLVIIAGEDTSSTENHGKGIGRIRLGRIDDASSNSLLEFIKTHVFSGSTIRTDGWLGYEPLVKVGINTQLPVQEILPSLIWLQLF